MPCDLRSKQNLSNLYRRELWNLSSSQIRHHPTVTVIKSDKASVRICGNFKQTVNPVTRLNCYPIRRVDDQFATLSKGKVFTRIDLSHVSQQLSLTEESKKFVIINTHKGLFCYTRLPFGISSASAILQRVMEIILQGIPKVVVYTWMTSWLLAT